MGDPAVILCRYCAQRCLGASTVEGIRFKSRLPHGFCGGDFPGPPSGNHLLEVVRQGHRLAASILALLFGNRDAFALTLQDILTLQFYDRREHGEHKLAGWRGCVDGLLATNELHLFSVSRSTRSSRSQVLRAKRLIDSTITVSPCRT